MKKSLLIICCFLSLSTFSQCSKTSKPEATEKTAADLVVTNNSPSITNEKMAENIILAKIQAMNDKDETKVKSYYIPSRQADNFRLENLKNTKLNKITLIDDLNIYNLERDQILKIPNIKEDLTFPFEIDQMKIYEVDYDIEYIDDSLEPITNGNHITYYILVKNKNNEWKISGIGQL